MKKNLIIFIACFLLCAMSVRNLRADTADDTTPASEYVEKQIATVRVMDKYAGKVRVLNLPVGRAETYEKLDITVRTCKASSPYQAENYFMFIEIAKKSTADSARIFSGWMERNEPGLNPLQDPDYDIWLVSCE